MLKKLAKIFAWILAVLVLLLVILLLYVRSVAKVDPPVPASMAILDVKVTQPDSGLYIIGNNWFRKSESGLYELYIEGAPFERGVVNGKLTHELVQYQEEVFTNQLHRLVPSSFYLSILKYFVGWFNRDLDKNISDEYKLEIYGVSQVASHDFDDIAPPYQRILNYHAAHDIGHALQNMSLVGCTAFATWDSRSEDSTLIIGRNFDFYVGDDFARDKIVAFYNPDKGYKFMMVTFGGMTGVLSGMNAEGLTVTINAAKSDVPSASATPVSLVAREILQYASTIKEAYTIAEKHKMFVAESFLIGSAKDGKASIIEKTPEGIDFYEVNGDQIVSTNHFLGKVLGQTPLNQEHIRTSASPYRFQRVEELLQENGKNSVLKTASILRNQKGLGGKDIGLGNEKLINQLVAHHGIIFQPEKRLVWISTAPWQLGKFVCYDLNKVFARKMERDEEIYEATLTIPADTFLTTSAYKDYRKFHPYRFPFNPRTDIQPDSLVVWNPNSYHAYMLAGDYYLDHEQYSAAAQKYREGLTKEVATLQEREHMEKNLKKAEEQLK
ncbi:C45 family autoproteolytic acyltransferase/hydolase [Ohtaekwangia koreensis]|uniref:Acyl-coenzyme A:6-aminopenicillanic acid acyl-transferase n=1 Tax=Ohtaekwangia koreensis TaxID=688867 RepID=A0A1T5JJ33_9BACT|nr:C45 family peptidase [Ohtaekwangia koreensis]SKC51470.1 Acyl-coenzyme A:6-aminopenicillanic acid acyl-transferase [Ohtaekwangia koreensis]